MKCKKCQTELTEYNATSVVRDCKENKCAFNKQKYVRRVAKELDIRAELFSPIIHGEILVAEKVVRAPSRYNEGQWDDYLGYC